MVVILGQRKQKKRPKSGERMMATRTCHCLVTNEAEVEKQHCEVEEIEMSGPIQRKK
jgi:hypothetical protein